MLALGFLMMIGMTLIADGVGFHVPKGYIYSAMAFLGTGRGSEHAFPSAQRHEFRSRGDDRTTATTSRPEP